MGGGNKTPPFGPPVLMQPPPYPGAPTSGYPPGYAPPIQAPGGYPAPNAAGQARGGDPFTASGINLDLPAWGGPYGAPLTGLQLDAMGAFTKTLGADPLVQSMDIQNLIQQTLGMTHDPEIEQMLLTGEKVMGTDIENALAQSREEYSALGLGPGASDRAGGLAKTAGEIANKSRLGLQQQAINARLGNRGVAASALPSFLQAFALPTDIAGQGYQIGSNAQQTADQQIQRMMAEFGRTQNGLAPILLSLLGGSPQQQVAYGPSGISQGADVLGALFGGLSDLGWQPFARK